MFEFKKKISCEILSVFKLSILKILMDFQQCSIIPSSWFGSIQWNILWYTVIFSLAQVISRLSTYKLFLYNLVVLLDYVNGRFWATYLQSGDWLSVSMVLDKLKVEVACPLHFDTQWIQGYWLSESANGQHGLWKVVCIVGQIQIMWLIDWLAARTVEWLVDWLIDWLIDWSIDRLIDWLLSSTHVMTNVVFSLTGPCNRHFNQLSTEICWAS